MAAGRFIGEFRNGGGRDAWPTHAFEEFTLPSPIFLQLSDIVGAGAE